ncbi:MAG: hypothetical protein J6K17_07445 [Oscillospiraceae bacterium]|nr:hypothetical protein [Oscillospiraceae bacterium]
MRKILSAIISLALCTAMLTACGKEGKTAEVTEQTTTEAVSETAAESAAEEAEISTAETTAAESTETKTEPVSGNSFATLDEFIEAAFELETETVPESLFFSYAEEHLNGDGLYFDMEAPDGSMKMLLAANKDSDLCLKAESNTESMYIYVKDGIMYMLDATEKSGFSMELDRDTVDSLTSEALGGMDITSELEEGESESAECVDVEIDGTAYTFENLEDIGALINKDGELYAIINGDESNAVKVLIVNEMSSNIPEGILELPTDYEIIDMTELLAALEEGENDGPAKTEFATMEEFLETDFSAYEEGTEYSADETLSAEMLDIMANAKCYYFETGDFYDESQSMIGAISEDKVMVNGTAIGADDVSKIIYDNEKAYIVNDEKKTVLVTSSEGLPSVEEYAEIVSFEMENDSIFYITEITIEGKNYLLETQKYDDDSCMLHNPDKTIYAAVIDGNLCKWVVTDDIPEGTFDIPSDYEVIDMDAMMDDVE